MAARQLVLSELCFQFCIVQERAEALQSAAGMLGEGLEQARRQVNLGFRANPISFQLSTTFNALWLDDSARLGRCVHGGQLL